MTQPPAYTRSFSYSNFASANPATPPPGTALDAEFDGLARTLTATLANLAKLQRDDGRPANQSITLESLSPAVLVALGAGVIWTPRGVWLTGTAYKVTDVVSSGTASYVCATAHTSAAAIATDVAAGRWIKLFDDAGTIPADGSVTAPKLGAGSVTTAAIGFTSLDLTGRIRALAGLQAGTAPAGGLLHGKLDAGSPFGKIERLTDDQGAVGYQIVGHTVTWELSEAANSTNLDVRRNGVLVGQFNADAGLDVAGAIRGIIGASPSTGSGLSTFFNGTTGTLECYNHTVPAWLDLTIAGKSVGLYASGVLVANATATGLDITGKPSANGIELGFRDIPSNRQDGAYTIAASDRGKKVFSKNTAGQFIAMPTVAGGGPAVDSAILIVNRGTSAITITTTGITMRLAGTALTGNRTIAVNGIATLLHNEADDWSIGGPGVA